MSTQRIQLDDLLAEVTPYEPHLMRIPKDVDALKPEDDYAHAAAKTATDILKRQGVHEIEITDEEAAKAEQIFDQRMQNLPNAITPKTLPTPATILKLRALLSDYDHKVVHHAEQVRLLVTNKLIELADHRDARVQLKALELLGKTADVGMFVEKQEITYKQQTDEELRNRLREKLGLVIDGEIVGERVLTTEEVKQEMQDPNAIPLPETAKVTVDSLSMLFNPKN